MVTPGNAPVQAIACLEKQEDPFIFSTDLIERLQLLNFAREVLGLALRLMPIPQLPSGPGRPDVYPDEVILVTIMVMTIWQLSPRGMVRRLRRWSALAQACGYDPLPVISASQLYRRRERLGLWAYFVTFCALVWRLIGLGIITGEDIILDSTVIEAFSLKDLEAAWHYTKRYGYKIHMLICRRALLPIMFLITPANRNDAPWAIPLLEMARRCFAFSVRVVRADAAYFTQHILVYIRTVLQAQPVIDFNQESEVKNGWLPWTSSRIGERREANVATSNASCPAQTLLRPQRMAIAWFEKRLATYLLKPALPYSLWPGWRSKSVVLI